METTTEPQTTPTAVPPEPDAESLRADIDLLRAIGSNPRTAHFLAELAAGGDARSLLHLHFPEEFDAAGDAPDEAAEPQAAPPGPAPQALSTPMYRSDLVPEPAPDSCPTFLSHISGGFWD